MKMTKMRGQKTRKTLQTKGKEYKIPRSATFKAKRGMPEHMTSGGGSKRHR